LPVPVVMQPSAGQRLVRPGTAPEVVVAARGDRAGVVAFATARLVAKAARDEDVADSTFAEPLHGRPQSRTAPALRAALANLVGGTGHFREPAAFPNIVADRFFDIHVFAGLHRPNGGQAVPVIWRGNGHRMNVAVVHDTAEILHDG